jgi:hypothetical protein
MNRVNQNDFLAFPRPNGDGVNAVIVAKLGTNRSGGTPVAPQPREPVTALLTAC